MNEKKNRKVTYAIGFAFFGICITVLVYIALNIKSIAILLGIPVPPSWYPDYKDTLPPESMPTVSDTSAAPSSVSAEWLEMYLSEFIYLFFEPFDSPENINSKNLVDFGAVLCAKDPEASYDMEMGGTVIPSDDVKLKQTSYFGRFAKDQSGNYVEYDSESKSYKLKASGLPTPYLVVISGYRIQGDSVTVNLNYYDYYTIIYEGVPATDNIEKKMSVVLKGSFPDYKIISFTEQ